RIGADEARNRPRAILARGASDHPGRRLACHRADDDRVEERLELLLLRFDLVGPAREPMAAERMVGRTGGDRVRLAATLLDLGERLLPARPKADVEAGAIEAHVGAHDPREQDVPD